MVLTEANLGTPHKDFVWQYNVPKDKDRLVSFVPNQPGELCMTSSSHNCLRTKILSPPINGKVPDSGEGNDTLIKHVTDKSSNWRYGPGPVRQKYADMLSVNRYEDISPPSMDYYM